MSAHIKSNGSGERLYEIGLWLDENFGSQQKHTWEAFIVVRDDDNNCPGVVRFDFYDPHIYTMFALKWL